MMRSSVKSATRSRLAVAVMCLVVTGCPGGDRADSSFSAAVANPAYSSNGPRVLFDEAHHNHHRAGTTYQPFVRLVESDGYRVSRGRERVSADVLRGVDVLVVAGALGTNERNDDAAFAPEECNAIQAWVASGCALLLVTDHYPFGHAVEDLGGRFGVFMSKGVVEDTANYDRSFDPTHIVYSATTDGLAAHPIIRGRDTSETVRKVLAFTGQAVSAPSPAVLLLRLSGTAVMRPPKPVVERVGNDIRVNVAYGDSEPALGLGQAVALDWGNGRVVITGEAAMLTAQLSRYDGRRFGINTEGYDNRQLVLNIMRWLTRVL
jgi:hypothetical protein